MSFIDTLRYWSAKNLLDLYVDGRLGAAQAARVARALERWPALKAEADALRPLKLTGEDRIAVPKDLAASILAKYQDAPQAEPETLAEALPAWNLTPAQAASALCLVLLAGVQGGVGVKTSAKPDLPVLEARR